MYKPPDSSIRIFTFLAPSAQHQLCVMSLSVTVTQTLKNIKLKKEKEMKKHVSHFPSSFSMQEGCHALCHVETKQIKPHRA